MSRFSEMDHDSFSNTANIGAGLTWDDVYAALVPHGVNVLGGRVPGVGVAGLTLGGGNILFVSDHAGFHRSYDSTGYSWKSNQYGLTVDSVVAFELVKPNGTIAMVTATSDPDLFVGLKVTGFCLDYSLLWF
jgi:FAD/FMN-containing dehydrogenase